MSQFLTLPTSMVLLSCEHTYLQNLNVVAHYLSEGSCFRMTSSSHSLGSIQLQVNWRWICWSPHMPINVSIIIPWKIQCLWDECFQPSLDITGSYVFPPLGLVPLVLSRFFAEHITGQFVLLIQIAPCWMEASWLPTVLNTLEHTLHWCPIIKSLIIDILISCVLRGLSLLHLTC